IIAGIIEKTKRSAAYRSVEGYVEAANNAAVLYDLDNNKGINVTEAKHTFTSNVDTDAFSKIKAKGTLPTYSYLDFDINKKVVTEGHFCINGYSVLYSDGTAKASETKYCEEDNTGSGSNSENGSQNESDGTMSKVKYNPDDDYLYGFTNGEWKKSAVRLYLKGDNLFAGGSYSVAWDTNPSNWWYQDGNAGGSWGINSSGVLIGWSPSSLATGKTGGCTIGTSQKIDLSKYNHAKVLLEDDTEKTLDISALNGEMYAVLIAYKWGSSNDHSYAIGFVSSKKDFPANDNVLLLQRTSTRTYIGIKAIWLE
ncbi:MAG: hypothetical protein IJ715_02255, partial [Bacilli bacterium]|nr:hypothetical protein [Bacilli bacterium]